MESKSMTDYSTDKEWEKIADVNPYYGVLTDSKYLNSNLTTENKKVFFETGVKHIHEIVSKIRQYIDSSYKINKALDFGCGVGRFLLPLSKISDEVVGIDISESMLSEAKNNCESQGINNVHLIKSDDSLSLLEGKYDFIHSFIVFQHIPVDRGEIIFEKLLCHLSCGGVCVVQFTFFRDQSAIISVAKKYLPGAYYFFNLLKGKKIYDPVMQMNTYNLNTIFSILQQNDIHKIYSEYTNHGGTLGIVLYFQKPSISEMKPSS
jgi:2-polyprenyl-3-methyl-5-hydroxy-6-metoxy-1,4-benzoquinol methylase